MCPDILHSLEGDGAFVVGVAQDLVQARCRDGLGAAPWRRRDAQAEGVEMVGQLTDCPISRRILGEGEAKQGSTLLIQLNRPDLSPMLISPPHIHIPQRCLTQRPAVPGLFSHPLHDLVSQVPGVELGDAAHDAVQEHATRRLVDVLTGRDQSDARLLKRPVYLHIIRPVPGQAVELVDDDVVDPAIFFEVRQHLL